MHAEPVARRAGYLRRIRAPAARLGWPEATAAALTLAFIAISVWWLVVDQNTPDGDSSSHLRQVFDYGSQLKDGHELYWFRYEPGSGAIYPPLVFLVGMIPGLFSSFSVDGPILALNLLFVPLLTAGCFGVASLAFGRRAGLLAVVFALATPVVIGQFHLFMLDLPLTALVAATAWAVLASDGFSSRKLTILAAVLAALGMLTKQSFAIFVAPLVVVVLARGGWRSWRNLIPAAAVFAVIALPWYLQHFHGLTRIANEATTQGTGINPYGPEYKRATPQNLAWYAWTMVNIHYFVPLALMYLIGLGHAIWSWIRRRPVGFEPELVISSLMGYLGISLLFGFQDPRYTIPALVFVAALGAGWIVRVPKPVGIAATAVLVAVLVVNNIAINTSAFRLVQIELPGASPTREFVENRLVLLDTRGYSGSRPIRTPRTVDLLEAAKAQGATNFSYDASPQTVEKIGLPGLFVFALATGLPAVPGDQLDSRGIYLERRPVPPGGPQPCQRFEDGTGLYVFRGIPKNPEPSARSRLYCPL